ncbi:MAG TPA: IS110 family transposase [Chloroflexota bacterium]|nr:IS110 family transposase [Chloroflexota bacterium]
MHVVYERCCGLDIHKKLVVACLFTPGTGGQPRKEIRTFGTMTDDLLKLADWLAAHEVVHVAMEATGVYWRSIFNLLEGTFELMLVNPQHMKAVPGRKTDVKDCEWLADLLRHGLVRGSFVPDRPQRELRELTRYRTALVRERSAEVNRLQKVLEGANIKLASVASNIVGKSGREILAALVAGTTDPALLAQLAKKKLRAKIPQLERALAGRVEAHQRFLLARQLAHLDDLDRLLGEVSGEIGRRLAAESDEPPAKEVSMTAAERPAGQPGAEAVERLQTIPGVGQRIAEVLVAEIGTDMSRFPTAAHLASWAGMCPGNNESAGKRKSGRTRKGSPWLRTALIEAAQAAGRTKDTYLAAQYHRLACRRGAKRAAVAVGHTILTVAYALLKTQTPYHELGRHYYDERDRRASERRLVRRLADLGYEVTLRPAEPAA